MIKNVWKLFSLIGLVVVVLLVATSIVLGLEMNKNQKAHDAQVAQLENTISMVTAERDEVQQQHNELQSEHETLQSEYDALVMSQSFLSDSSVTLDSVSDLLDQLNVEELTP